MELTSRITFPKNDPTVLGMAHRNFLWESTAIVTTTFTTQHKGAILLKKVCKMYFMID